MFASTLTKRTAMSRPSRRRQRGFTLIELLAVIAVIVILAGILVPAIFGALTRSREFAITNEVTQLDLAIEKFKADHKFYPPAIGPGLAIDTTAGGPNPAAQMLPYLNKISRRHAEGDGSGGTRLANWWTNVGSKLDERSSMVFWLSGICKNKQFPLSGMSATSDALAPYAVDQYWDGTPVGADIERNVLYEFNQNQLELTVDNIMAYNQPYGSADMAYRYLDHRSYMAGGAYAQTPTTYVNPEKFQLVGPGMDGVLAEVSDPIPRVFNTLGGPHDDNMVNFAPGRLDIYINDNN